MESLITLYFDPEKDVAKVRETVRRFKEARAREILPAVFTADFSSQAWELTQSGKPYEFNYEIKEGPGGVRLVHQSDYYAGKDILEVTTKKIRNGLEFDQMMLARQKILSAEIGGSVVWISPKKLDDERDCPYPDTQINIAQKISDNLVSVRQFQSRYLDLRGSARFLNTLLGEERVVEEPELAELMTLVGQLSHKITTESVQELIFDLTGFRPTAVVIDPDKAAFASQRYLELVLSGLSGEPLVRQRGELLKGIIGQKVFEELCPAGEVAVAFSCGMIEFSRAGSAIPSWCEVTMSGEIKCRLCEQKLRLAETKTHRCIC